MRIARDLLAKVIYARITNGQEAERIPVNLTFLLQENAYK